MFSKERSTREEASVTAAKSCGRSRSLSRGRMKQPARKPTGFDETSGSSMADIEHIFDEFTDKYPRCRYTIRCWTPRHQGGGPSDVRPVPSTQRTSGGILRPRHRGADSAWLNREPGQRRRCCTRTLKDGPVVTKLGKTQCPQPNVVAFTSRTPKRSVVFVSSGSISAFGRSVS